MYGIYYIIPYITNNRKDEQMKDLDKLLISTKINALLELKNKIQEEIDELEKKVGEDEIPF